MADAEALHDRLDFATFIDIAESPQLPLFRDGQPQWKRVERSSTFTLLKRENEVLALARLDASVEEVAKILGPTTDQMHAYQQLSVKTSNFVHSDMLGKNEQWCFAEILCCKSEGDSFTLTQGSLSAQLAHSLPARSALKDSSRRVAQLRDVTAAYLVERMPGNHGLRVAFHAIHKPNAKAEHESEDRTLTPKLFEPGCFVLHALRFVASQMLADLLDQVVDDDEDSGRRHAAFKVLNQLITANQADTQIQVDKNATLLRKASASPQSLKVAKQALDVSECPKDLKACKFASAESRPYPMMPAVIKNDEEESKEDDPLIYPIPSNEEVRMAAIEHLRLHEVVNIPELNVICTLAAAEMNCPHSVLTLVERDVVTLMATNDPENWDLGSGNPREQTFCQHFVMDDKPLLVRHAEADMRDSTIVMQSVRLHLDKRVESSTPFSATTTSEPSAWNNGEPPAPPLSLSIALRGLMAGAEALHDGVDFANFVNIAGSPQLPFFRNDQTQWKRVERSTVFTLLKRDDEVLAQARLDASIEEVASVLGATTDQLHAATMEGLYDDAFIAGSVAYVERPHENDQEFKQLAVKTSNFVHSKILGKNEQWCFGETLRSKPEGDSFTITQSSLEADQSQSLPARLALKDTKRRVAQLRDVSTAYLVERTTDTQRCVSPSTLCTNLRVHQQRTDQL
ncbi:hypothetical protein GQ600_17965 [Phytophthora cactorum]|nr:hypothetical protein GQ600_17965 [Phytophthora cactorum]